MGKNNFLWTNEKNVWMELKSELNEWIYGLW